MKDLWLNVLFVSCLTLLGCQSSQKSTTSPSTGLLPDSTPILLPVKVSGKWGYANGSGQLVITPQFDDAQEFHEGRAEICLGKPCDWFQTTGEARWGFIDTSGKVVITPQYASETAFSEGLAAVCAGDCGVSPTMPHTYGYIDREGKLVIPAQFGVAYMFRESLARVCIGKCDWEKDSGYNGKFGFIDHSGRFVINPQYDEADDFKNGFAQVTVGKGNDAKIGYIDKTGKTIWQPSN
jgi:hypothetical protein